MSYSGPLVSHEIRITLGHSVVTVAVLEIKHRPRDWRSSSDLLCTYHVPFDTLWNDSGEAIARALRVLTPALRGS